MLEHNFVMVHLTFAERESNLLFVPAGRRIYSMCDANSQAKQSVIIPVQGDHGHIFSWQYSDAPLADEMRYDAEQERMALNRASLAESQHPRETRFIGSHVVVLDSGQSTLLAMSGLSPDGVQFTAELWEGIHRENHPDDTFEICIFDHPLEGAGNGYVSVVRREALG